MPAKAGVLSLLIGNCVPAQPGVRWGKGEQGQAKPQGNNTTPVGSVALKSSGCECPDHSAQTSKQGVLTCVRGPCTSPALTAPLRARLRPGDGSCHSSCSCPVVAGETVGWQCMLLPRAAASES